MLSVDGDQLSEIVDTLGSMQYFKVEKGRLREKTVHIYLMLHKDGITDISPREGERYVSCEWLSFDDALARVTQKEARALISRARRVLERRDRQRKRVAHA